MGIERYRPAVLLLRSLAGLALLWLALSPTELLEQGPGVCLVRRLLGFQCLGCGMLRALSSLLHGRLEAALSYNKLSVLVLPAALGLLFYVPRRCDMLLRGSISLARRLARHTWTRGN